MPLYYYYLLQDQDRFEEKKTNLQSGLNKEPHLPRVRFFEKRRSSGIRLLEEPRSSGTRFIKESSLIVQFVFSKTLY